VVIGPGLVLTNAHHVHHDGVTVRTMDGHDAQATVAGIDRDGDIAVLQASVEGAALAFASRPVTVGTPVLALGVAYRGPRVTFGLVSAVGQAFRGPQGRRIGGSIEHTAPLAPGSSGSALLGLDGALVGLNTSRLGGGFYQAIPTDEAMQSRITRLAAGEHVARPRLGVAIAPSWIARRMRAAVGLASRDGLLVREVEEGSRAEAAGILVGDLIVSAAENPVIDPDDLGDAIEGTTGTLHIRLVRGDQELDVVVALGA
jgi:S1-C subfamily serine protease